MRHTSNVKLVALSIPSTVRGETSDLRTERVAQPALRTDDPPRSWAVGLRSGRGIRLPPPSPGAGHALGATTDPGVDAHGPVALRFGPRLRRSGRSRPW